MQQRRKFIRPYFILASIWLVSICAFVFWTANNSIETAKNEVQETGWTLQRLLSQRAAQHDAHLTSLNALLLASNPPPIDALRQVARNIIRFYPRITGIDVLLLDVSGADITVQPLLMVDEQTNKAVITELAPKIATQKPGVVYIYLSPSTPERYYLGKKSDNSNPGFALLMEINPALMIEPDERPQWADLTLEVNGQTLLAQPSSSDAVASPFLEQPVFSQRIDSQNQPIRLTISRPLDVAEVIEPQRTLLFAIVSLIILLAAFAFWRSIQSAKLAEQRAQRLEHETRLAHAARVNSMGELASGIAHELTQPLTALLSQSQAALRLSDAGDNPQMLQQALTANVRQATRAGEILQRMRHYMSNREPERHYIELNPIIRDVASLVETDLAKRQIALQTDIYNPSPHIFADAVEVEQVLYNLIRNAADSLDESDARNKQITVNTEVDDGQVVITVADNGTGIQDDILPHLFDPFFTTREHGMGLGLALCASLIERIDGEISAANSPTGGAILTIRLPLAKPPASKDSV